MSKKKKALKIIITIGFICLLIVSVIVGYYVEKSYYTNSALNYLCEKYNATEEEFELVESENGYFYFDRILFFELKWSSFKWKYRYNNIVFNVERINNNYYDDYQLNDLYDLTTAYLKENISNDIVGIYISSDMIYLHKNKYDAYENTQLSGFNQNKLWNEDETKEFWKSQIIENLYLYVDSMDNKEFIAENISKMIGKVNCIIICPTDTKSKPYRINDDSKGVVIDSIELKECGDTYVYWIQKAERNNMS